MTRRSWIIVLFLSVFIVAVLLLALSQNAPAESGTEQSVDLTEASVPDHPILPPTPQPEPDEALTRVSAPNDLTFTDVTGTQHFTDCAFRTGTNAVIGVPAAVRLEGGLDLEPGDEIGIFTPDGSQCTGAAVWTGSNIAIAAWQDDPQTDEIDGLQEGDELLFIVWDASAGEEVKVTAVGFEMGDGVYTADGIYVVGQLKGK